MLQKNPLPSSQEEELLKAAAAYTEFGGVGAQGAAMRRAKMPGPMGVHTPRKRVGLATGAALQVGACRGLMPGLS